ncbi:MAG: GNAT family N-acetyltransferase [Gammaproteobacteria bacterium]|jgi:GNAT superfamily N-acetyltransferase
MKLSLREARSSDARVLGPICYEAFRSVCERHAFPPDFPNSEVPTGLFEHVIPRKDIYTVVAEMDGRIVGSNVLWENGEIAGVGPITVDPGVQGNSVGRMLMDDVLSRAKASGFDGVRLVQVPFNNLTMALYTKLGFDVKEPLSVMHGPTLKSSMPGFHVRSATSDDLERCDALCRQVHGHDRHGDLDDAIQQGTATVVERDGRITGYASSVGFFGHAVGETNEDIKALISNAEEFTGPGFHIPSRNADLMRWCLSNGFRIRQPMTLMSIGPYQEPEGAFVPSVIF